jgi:hypothetical protein
LSQASTSQHNASIAQDSRADGHGTEMSKISTDVTSMKSTLTSFQESLDFFSTKFDDFKTQLDAFESVLRRVAELEKNNADLMEKVETLTEKTNKLEQNSFSNDLVLCGIPEVERDDTTTDIVVCDFLREIGVSDVSPNDIKFARRINPAAAARGSSNSSRHRPPKILARFYSEQTRDYVKFKIRAMKRRSPTIKFADSNINYYAADFLSPFNSQLFNNAKDFAKQQKFFSVWISNGNILLKKSNNSQPIIISSVKDILSHTSINS